MSNAISAAGRLTADAELRYSGDQPVLGFTVASDVGFGDKKNTNFFRCTLWGKRGESLAHHLNKGQQVTIFGVLSLREFESNGVKRLSPDVRIGDIVLQGRRGDNQEAPADHREPAAAAAPQRRPALTTPPAINDIDDDIPF